MLHNFVLSHKMKKHHHHHHKKKGDNEAHKEGDEKQIPADVHKTCIKSGHLIKLGFVFQTWKRRFFVLRESVISYYPSETATTSLRDIPLTGGKISMSTITQHPYPFCLQLKPTGTTRVFLLAADNPYEQRSWFESITFAIAAANKQALLLQNKHGKQAYVDVGYSETLDTMVFLSFNQSRKELEYHRTHVAKKNKEGPVKRIRLENALLSNNNVNSCSFKIFENPNLKNPFCFTITTESADELPSWMCAIAAWIKECTSEEPSWDIGLFIANQKVLRNYIIQGLPDDIREETWIGLSGMDTKTMEKYRLKYNEVINEIFRDEAEPDDLPCLPDFGSQLFITEKLKLGILKNKKFTLNSLLESKDEVYEAFNTRRVYVDAVFDGWIVVDCDNLDMYDLDGLFGRKEKKLSTEIDEPKEEHLRDHKRVLRILSVLATINSANIQYCPMLPDLVVLLLVFLSEDDAFAVLQHMLNRSKSDKFGVYFPVDGLNFTKFIYAFPALLQKHAGKIYKHGKSLKVDFLSVFANWVSGFFVKFLPTATLLHLLDYFLLRGFPALFELALAIFLKIENVLLSTNTVEQFDFLCSVYLKVPSDDIVPVAASFQLKNVKQLCKNSGPDHIRNYKYPKSDVFHIPKLPLSTSTSGDIGGEYILNTKLLYKLWSMLNVSLRMYEPKLLFQTNIDGYSLETLMQRMPMEIEDEHALPYQMSTILLIKDEKEGIFGVFLSGTWKHSAVSQMNINESFIFVLKPDCKRYSIQRTNNANNDANSRHIMVSTSDEMLAIGDTSGIDVLTLDASLNRGTSKVSPLFNNSSLSHCVESNGSFKVMSVELWGFKDILH